MSSTRTNASASRLSVVVPSLGWRVYGVSAAAMMRASMPRVRYAGVPARAPPAAPADADGTAGTSGGEVRRPCARSRRAIVLHLCGGDRLRGTTCRSAGGGRGPRRRPGRGAEREPARADRALAGLRLARRGARPCQHRVRGPQLEHVLRDSARGCSSSSRISRGRSSTSARFLRCAGRSTTGFRPATSRLPPRSGPASRRSSSTPPGRPAPRRGSSARRRSGTGGRSRPAPSSASRRRTSSTPTCRSSTPTR